MGMNLVCPRGSIIGSAIRPEKSLQGYKKDVLVVLGNTLPLSAKRKTTKKVGCISTIMTTTLAVTYWHKIREANDGRRGISIFSLTEQVCFLMSEVGGLVFCKKQFQHHKALSLACRFKGKM